MSTDNKTYSHFDLSDEVFVQKFVDCTLNPALFSHEAHLRLAWIHVTRYGLRKAIENIRAQIATYDRGLGDGTKYHETITVAAICVVHHFTLKSTAATFKQFIAEFPQLRSHFRELLTQHYSFDIARDPGAKREYVRPDILPFDQDHK